MNLIPVAVVICSGLVFGHASPPATADSCQAKMTAFPLDPGSRCCTQAAEYKIIAGPIAQIDDHPWAALIYYDLKKGSKKQLCSGTLISGRYVLTAAHCIVGQITNIGTPTEVRLGEYDFNHDGPDCVTVDSGVDCTDGAVSIEIETTIPHPKFAYPNHPSKWNDIGLIRLKEAVPYTDFIRPICLPTTNPETNPPDRSLYVVSWNQKTGNGIKALYKVPFVNQEKCQTFYRERKVVVLAEGQLCAGGLEGMDACKGDGGGPLVYKNNQGIAELTGIVSFGPVPCGQKDFPSVYTNVYVYLDWIKTVIVE